MKTYRVSETDSATETIDDRTATMTHDYAACCDRGHTPLVRSARRVYCYECGVWWWWARGEKSQ